MKYTLTTKNGMTNMKFKTGDKVVKPKGYSFDSEVRSVFTTINGDVRVVAELTTSNGLGMLHIFNESQLEHRDDQLEFPKFTVDDMVYISSFNKEPK